MFPILLSASRSEAIPDEVTSGRLFTWGSGTEGGLGHGNTTTYSSPVQVGSEKTWARGIKGGDGGWFQACRIKSSA